MSPFDRRVENTRELARKLLRHPRVQLAVERAAREHPNSVAAARFLFRVARSVAGAETTTSVLNALGAAALIPWQVIRYIWESGRE